MTRSTASIAIGIALACGLTLGSGTARADEPAPFSYVGIGKCKICHKKESIGDQYGAWAASGHAKAFETLLGEAAVGLARERGIEGPPSESGECLACHATAYGVAAEGSGENPLEPSDGVQCETCHGPGSAYRKKTVMEDREASLANGLVVPDEQTCLRCHNERSPTWDPARYTLADGTTTGFDYAQALAKIAHAIPKQVERESAGAEAQPREDGAGE